MLYSTTALFRFFVNSFYFWRSFYDTDHPISFGVTFFLISTSPMTVRSYARLLIERVRKRALHAFLFRRFRLTAIRSFGNNYFITVGVVT
jgi:hypothetical protein